VTDVFDFYSSFLISPNCFFDVKDQRAEYKLDLETKKISVVGGKQNGIDKAKAQ